MNTGGFSKLEGIFSIPLGTQLSLVVAQIAEVYPGTPATGGARQELRLRSSSNGALFSVHIFDYAEPIQQRAEGGFLRVSASPHAKRAIVWERSKATRPSAGNIGTLVVRKNAHVEVFSSADAARAGDLGFRVAELAPAPTPAAPVAQVPDPAAPAFRQVSITSAASKPPLPIGEDQYGALVEVSRRFGLCLQAAREALGESASVEDVHAAARVAYSQVFHDIAA
jgi:hypothetical protein